MLNRKSTSHAVSPNPEPHVLYEMPSSFKNDYLDYPNIYSFVMWLLYLLMDLQHMLSQETLLVDCAGFFYASIMHAHSIYPA